MAMGKLIIGRENWRKIGSLNLQILLKGLYLGGVGEPQGLKGGGVKARGGDTLIWGLVSQEGRV